MNYIIYIRNNKNTQVLYVHTQCLGGNMNKYRKKWNDLKDNDRIVRYIDGLPQVQNNTVYDRYRKTFNFRAALDTNFDGTAGMNKEHFKRTSGKTQAAIIKEKLASGAISAAQIEAALCDPHNQTDPVMAGIIAVLEAILIKPSRQSASDEAWFGYIYSLPEIQTNHRGKFKNLSNQTAPFIGADGLLTLKKERKEETGDSKTLDYSYNLTDANGETQIIYFAHKSNKKNGGGQKTTMIEFDALTRVRGVHVVQILEGEGNNSYNDCLERNKNVNNPFCHVCNSIPEAIRLAESLYPQEITCK